MIFIHSMKLPFSFRLCVSRYRSPKTGGCSVSVAENQYSLELHFVSSISQNQNDEVLKAWLSRILFFYKVEEVSRSV